VALAVALLGETLHWPQIIGALLILGSAGVLQWSDDGRGKG
jgi:drug/metabolite transporter (DMT)-like permease